MYTMGARNIDASDAEVARLLHQEVHPLIRVELITIVPRILPRV